MITSRSFVGGSGRTFLGGTCGDSWKDSSCRTASELWGDSYDSAAVSTGDFIRDFTGVPTRVLGFCRNLAGMRGVIPSFLRGHRGKPCVKKATGQWPALPGAFPTTTTPQKVLIFQTSLNKTPFYGSPPGGRAGGRAGPAPSHAEDEIF